jgi:hypothetical protein
MQHTPLALAAKAKGLEPTVAGDEKLHPPTAAAQTLKLLEIPRREEGGLNARPFVIIPAEHRIELADDQKGVLEDEAEQLFVLG